MDEFLIFLLGMAALAVAIAAPILAVIALVRTSKGSALGRRLAALERELERLRMELGRRGGAASAETRSEVPHRIEPHPGSAAEREQARHKAREFLAPTEIAAPRAAEPGEGTDEFDWTSPAASTPALEVETPVAREPQARPAQAQPAEGAPMAPPPLGPPRQRIDWERWVGVRGAAVVGGAVAALAGLLFVQYSISKGWITESMRVGFSALFGAALMVLGEWLRPRRFTFVPDALTGAGAVVLYGAAWAADRLYDLIGMWTALGAMALITALTCWLSHRHRSQLLAIFALVGGFATPLLLSVQDSGPLPLFGYVLLLDLGLLFLARQRAWSGLYALGLAGTGLIQAVWIYGSMQSDELWWALVSLGLFAALFVGVGGAGEQRWLRATRTASILLPFAFALTLAPRADLGEHVLPSAALVAMLCAGAGWLAREPFQRPLALAAGGAAAAFFALFASGRELGAGLAWELALCALGVALVLHLFEELGAHAQVEGQPRLSATGHGASLAAVGLMSCLAIAVHSSGASGIWPWIMLFGGLYALLLRQEFLQPLPGVSVAGAILLAFGLCNALGAGWNLAGERGAFEPTSAVWALGLFLVTTLFVLSTLQLRGEPRTRAALAWAAGLHPVPYLLFLASAATFREEPLWMLVLVALALICAIGTAAARLGSAPLYTGAVGLAVLIPPWLLLPRLAQMRAAGVDATREFWLGEPPGHGDLHAVLAVLIAGAALLAAWPLLSRKSFTRSRLAAYAAGAPILLTFPTARAVLAPSEAGRWAALLPLGLALVAAGLFALREARAGADEAERSARTAALASYGFAAVLLAVLSLTLTVERETLAVTLALAAAGLALLWRRIDHAGLKYVATACALVAVGRLVANLFVDHHWPHQETRLFNALLYGLLLPGTALLAASALLVGREVERLRDWEGRLYAAPRPLLAAASGLAGLVGVFLWINVAIFDWFATGEWIELWSGRMQARDLTTSIAWAVYALVLLGIGMARHSTFLRWISLVTLVLTLAKAFLYDLAELEGLYRVASLVGLACSLIAVSLLYQHFVFGRARAGTSHTEVDRDSR